MDDFLSPALDDLTTTSELVWLMCKHLPSQRPAPQDTERTRSQAGQQADRGRFACPAFLQPWGAICEIEAKWPDLAAHLDLCTARLQLFGLCAETKRLQDTHGRISRLAWPLASAWRPYKESQGVAIVLAPGLAGRPWAGGGKEQAGCGCARPNWLYSGAPIWL